MNEIRNFIHDLRKGALPARELLGFLAFLCFNKETLIFCLGLIVGAICTFIITR